MHIQADCAGFHSFTLSSKFQISMPKEVRETLNMKPGQRLAFLCVGKSVQLVPTLAQFELRRWALLAAGRVSRPTG